VKAAETRERMAAIVVREVAKPSSRRHRNSLRRRRHFTLAGGVSLRTRRPPSSPSPPNGGRHSARAPSVENLEAKVSISAR
jgi:hypothetical protein